MKIRLLSVGTRLPGWVNEGFETYAVRLPRDNSLQLEEIPTSRTRGSTAQRIRDEGLRLLKRVDASDYVVALHETGKPFTSRELSAALEGWRHLGADVILMVGGADGLSDECLARADVQWSLSRHTLPHGLARILVAEQVYRAWTLLSGHPYHRD